MNEKVCENHKVPRGTTRKEGTIKIKWNKENKKISFVRVLNELSRIIESHEKFYWSLIHSHVGIKITLMHSHGGIKSKQDL